MARVLKEQVPIVAFPVLGVFVLMIFPDELVRMMVGGAVVVYSFLVLPPLEASAVLCVYIIGVIYLHFSARDPQEPLRFRQA